MFGHWAAAVSPREEEENATMANHARNRAGDPARGTPDGRRGGGGEDRCSRDTGRDPTWADLGAEDEEERPGRLLHQAAIYNNVELLQVYVAGHPPVRVFRRFCIKELAISYFRAGSSSRRREAGS